MAVPHAVIVMTQLDYEGDETKLVSAQIFDTKTEADETSLNLNKEFDKIEGLEEFCFVAAVTVPLADLSNLDELVKAMKGSE